jgi:hypothetical protein
MPVDPSGVNTDDQGQGGGGEQRPDGAPSTDRAPVADAQAGLPPVGGIRRSGNGSNNGHIGLPEVTASEDPSRAAPLDDDVAAAERLEAVASTRSDRGGAAAESASARSTAPPGPSATHAAPTVPAQGTRTEPRPTIDPALEPGGDGAAGDGEGAAEAGGARITDGLAALRARPRRSGKRKGRRGLRVRQRLWSIDPWSVFKLSTLFYICLCGILLVAGTLLWNVGRSVGTIDDIESFVTRMGAYGTCTLKAEVPAGTPFEEDDDCAEGEVLVGGYKFDDGTMFRMAAIGGGILVVAGSIGNVLMVVLVNLLNELTGGLRYTIVKEPIPRPAGGRKRGLRPAAGRAAAGRPDGPRHAMRRPDGAPPDGPAEGAAPVRVPAVEGSTDPGMQR